MSEITILGIKVDAKQALSATRQVGRAFKGLGKQVFSLRGAIAGAGIGLLLKGISSSGKEFEQSIANLGAITGATGKDLEFLADKAKEFGKTTTLSATQAATALKLIASAKPDLLESGEALSFVTEQAIALAEATGQDLATSADTLGTSLNQFSAGAEEAGRFINVLAAGAKFGSSAVRETAEALKFAGTVASAAGISFEKTNAAIQLLAKIGIKGGEAGSALRNVFLKLAATGRDDLNPEIVGLSQALTNLKAEGYTTAEMTKLFGLRSVVAANQLVAQIDELQNLTLKLTDTGTAYEQQIKNTDTLDGSIKALGSAFESLQITLAAGVNPALRDLTDAGTSNLRAIDNMFNRMAEGGDALSSILVPIMNGVTFGFGAMGLAIGAVAAKTEAFFEVFAGPMMALFRSNAKLLSGDLSGALDELTNAPDRIGSAWNRIGTINKLARDDIAALHNDIYILGPAAIKTAMEVKKALASAFIIEGGAKEVPKAIDRFKIRIEQLNKVREESIASGKLATTVNSEYSRSVAAAMGNLASYTKQEKEAAIAKTNSAEATGSLTDANKEAAKELEGMIFSIRAETGQLGLKGAKLLEQRLRYGDLSEAVANYKGDTEALILAIIKEQEAHDRTTQSLKDSTKAKNDAAAATKELEQLIMRYGTTQEKQNLLEINLEKTRLRLVDAGMDAVTVDRLLNEERTRGMLSLQNLNLEEQKHIATLQAQANMIDAQISADEANGLLSARDAAYAHNKALDKLIEAEEKYIAVLREKGVLDSDPRIMQHKASIVKLGAQYKTLGKEVSDTLEGPFTDFFDDIMDGTKSVEEAFRDMAMAILNEFTNLIAKDLGRQLAQSIGGGFSGGGSGGGGSSSGGLLGDIFGGIGGLFGGSSGATSRSVSLDEFFSPGFNAFAGGTDFAAGGLSLVGEKGPELVNLPRGSKVTPNDKMGGVTINQTNNITVSGGGQQGRETGAQIAAQIGMSTNRVLKRNT